MTKLYIPAPDIETIVSQFAAWIAGIYRAKVTIIVVKDDKSFTEICDRGPSHD